MKYKITIEVTGEEPLSEMEHNCLIIASTIQSAMVDKIKPVGISNEFTDAYYRDFTVKDRFENLIIIKKPYRLKDQPQSTQDRVHDRNFRD